MATTNLTSKAANKAAREIVNALAAEVVAGAEEIITKQQEIKKGLTGLVFCEDGSTLEEFTDKILNYLHFKGCVIKVDREMPECCHGCNHKKVESLIEKVPA